MSRVPKLLFESFALALVATAVIEVGTVRVLHASSEEAEEVTFSKHIAPIIFSRCAICHRPNRMAPMSLMTYEDARPWARAIKQKVVSREMPPWGAEPGIQRYTNDPSLSQAEIDTIVAWVDTGAPRGNPEDLPSLPKRTDGWQHGQPDLVVTPLQRYTLGARGQDAFRLFVIPLPIAERRYVRGVEFRPGNRRVIHHVNMLLDRTPGSRQKVNVLSEHGDVGLVPRSAASPPGHFLGWAPGQLEPLLPERSAWDLDPGTDLVVQLHLVPSGRPEVVDFSVGFFFGTDPPTQSPLLLRLSRQNIDIPVGESNYTISDSLVLPVDVDVLSVRPHAHSLAREIQVLARLPDRTTKWLLHIKHWDSNWQHEYRYTEPVPLPSGTQLMMRYTYDNSAHNPRNPHHPPRRVRWGPLSSDEMGDLWVQVLTRDERDLATLARKAREKALSADVVGYENLLKEDAGNVPLHQDIATLYMELGKPEDAVVHLETVARLQHESAAAHYNLGVALAAAERTDEALEQYRQTLRLVPDHGPAYNNMGSLFMRRGELEKAGSAFEQALRIAPRSPDIHYNAALVLEKLGERTDAVRHLREAIQLRPDLTPALTVLAWILATVDDDQLKDAEEALRLAERAVIYTKRRDVEALDVLAAAYAATGRFDRAVEVIEEALSSNPSEPVNTSLLERRDSYVRGDVYREAAAGTR